jgi:hypothetical protein
MESSAKIAVHGGILAISWQDFLSTEWRIISVHLYSFVNPERPFSILNLLQVIWNWYDMDPVLDLYPNQTFSILPQQNCSFIFFIFFVRLL